MAKPRFECDVCGADRETVTCNGEGCGAQICQDCIKGHERNCIERNGIERNGIERNGDKTACDAAADYRYTVLPGGVGIRRTKR